MPSSNVFEWTCQALDDGTSLERLEARGTIRIALKAAGLESKDVTASQMDTLLHRILPSELESRGIGDAALVCDRLAQQLGTQSFGESADVDSPASIFARLGGDSASS